MRQAYICGPYTSDSEAGVLRNCLSAIDAAWKVSRFGYHPIIPHCMGPHRGMSWETAMARCCELVSGLSIEQGDILATIPGWEHSKGALEEVAIAEKLGIPVIHMERFQ